MPLSIDEKGDIAFKLQRAVDGFNKELSDWMEETGCRVSFGWQYGHDKNVKSIEIQAIDLIVHRKPPPSFETIKEALEKKV